MIILSTTTIVPKLTLTYGPYQLESSWPSFAHPALAAVLMGSLALVWLEGSSQGLKVNDHENDNNNNDNKHDKNDNNDTDHIDKESNDNNANDNDHDNIDKDNNGTTL